jgi:cytochrome c-type biogenesis protein
LLLRTFLLGGTSALVASPCATPVLASLLAYLALASTSTSGNEVVKGAVWMLAYTLGYSTPLLVVGATGGQALVNLQSMKSRDGMNLFSWITPLTGGVLIMFGFNGFLVALLGDPSLAGLAPIIE